MSRRLMFAALSAVAMSGAALAQTAADKVSPTIPETQIAPADLSSPFEFLSVATSADEFVIDAAALAATNAESATVKSLAQDLAASHTAMMAASQAAGKADKVEIAAPAPDGEQTGLLGKLEALKGAEFDRSWVEAMLFANQRTIAYYSGYSDEGDSLARFAAETLPQLNSHRAALRTEAEKVGIGEASQQAPAN